MRILILGGGPAGVTAALHAREYSADVTLIERARVGGTSYNLGPAPVRTLARAARLMRDTSSWATFGIRGERPGIDLRSVLANADRVARYAHEKKRMADFLRSRGVDLVEGAGPASFVDGHTVRVPDGRTWTADRIILCVGGHPGSLPIPGADLALTFADVRSLTQLPGRVAVVGGADTGCQLASIFADFGCEVSLMEVSGRINPRADEDISIDLRAAFEERGMRVLTAARLEGLEQLPTGIGLRYLHDGAGALLEADAVFFAVGWPANLEDLNLAAAGVATERAQISVDDRLRTSAPHIYAAGDVNGRSMLVQSARYEGRVAAENAILGPARRVSYEVVPSGSFTDPEYASVGLTETEAQEGHDCTVGIARHEDLLRPVADGHPEGFCKLIVDRHNREVLGGHVLGEYAVEVIQVVATCMAANMRVEQVAELQLSFPTFTEAVAMAAQKVVRELGVARLPEVWSTLEAQDWPSFTDREAPACG